MTRPRRDLFFGLLLSGLLIAAVLVTVLTPMGTAQRIAASCVIGAALVWLAVLLIALARTPEGVARLGGSPPLALDLLPAVALIGCAILVDALGPPRPGTGPWLAGLAVGAVLMVPFSLTVRWLWFERGRRRQSPGLTPEARPRSAGASPGDRDRPS